MRDRDSQHGTADACVLIVLREAWTSSTKSMRLAMT